MEKQTQTIDYQQARKDLADYFAEMGENYLWAKENIAQYEENEDFSGIDEETYIESIRYVRLWEIIQNDLTPNELNLTMLHAMYDGNSKLICAALGGRNKASIQTMLTRCRKKIKTIYKEKYG